MQQCKIRQRSLGNRAVARLGLTEEDFDKPKIAMVNSYVEVSETELAERRKRPPVWAATGERGWLATLSNRSARGESRGAEP